MIHHVFANKSNVGDWLSARSIQTLLGLPMTEHFCDGPFVADTIDALRRADRGDLVIVGGGGLLMDYFAEFWEKFRAIGERVPYVLWGVGGCDIKRENSLPRRALLAEIAERSRLCVVRDELTRELLPPLPQVEAMPCPTLNLITPRAPGCGVLHVDAFDNVGEANYERMDVLGENFARTTGRSFVSINNLIPQSDEATLARVLADYEGADLVLTGRLHGCIIGLAMGRKVLAVSGDRKIESFMGAAGLRDWVLELDEVETIPHRLAELENQPHPEEFLNAARRGNEVVAARVRALLN